jgi:flagellar biosynthetic protein FliS
MKSTELSYRRTAAEGASGFGLLIALYDVLAGDLRRAADAERNNNIGKRCIEINHALLVIGYLEHWLDRSSGAELADKLTSLYSSMRKNLIKAQAKRSVELLEQQMELVLNIRGIWQRLEFSLPDARDGGAGVMVHSDQPSGVALDRSRISSWIG